MSLQLHYRLVPLLLAFALAPATATTLYDASAGSLPAAQGWSTLAIGAAANQAITVGTPPTYSLDTTGVGVSYYGNAMLSPMTFDTAAGFDLSFGLKVVSETHDSNNRAGYSVVLVGADPTKAVEISFWAGNIWVPDYDANHPDRFVHGIDVAFDTSSLHTYVLSVRDHQYTISTGGSTLLAGTLHDYTAGGPPYTTPNFVFFGDNSSRGRSITELAFVSLTPVPEPGSAALLCAGLLVLGLQARRRAPKRPVRVGA